MEKAIEIKRRAQRCIQSGDLAGALSEYQKLARADDADPYNYVLIADLQFKMGAQSDACQSYLAAVQAYETAKLFKNAIAICKKMIRLSLSPPVVLQRLAQLHAQDGLGTEAALYYMQYAEHLVREEKYAAAVETLQKAVEVCPENVRTLEKLAEAQLLAARESDAIESLLKAARAWRAAGHKLEFDRARNRAEKVRAGSTAELDDEDPDFDDAEVEVEDDAGDDADEPAAALPADEAPAGNAEPAGAPAGVDGIAPVTADDGHPEGFESGRRTWSGPARTEESWQPSESQIEPPSEPRRPVPPPLPSRAAEIEAVLREAERKLKAGDREGAAAALLRAAEGYEQLDRPENAASIYRSLARSANVPPDVLPRWFDNCERRGDRVEASQVACQLGDRALNEADQSAALGWFRRANEFDPANDLARRRLERLGGAPPAAATPARAAAPPPAAGNSGRVAVAVGKAQAVTFDLGAMLDEFQRAVGEQLSGDAQSHYDLGMSYREMGLIDQAIASFRTAAESPDYAVRCTEMIGRCLLDQGQIDAAVEEFTNALARDLPAEAALTLRYQLGLAYEAAGRPQQALAEFEQVAGAQATYQDVAQKIRALRRSLENV